MQIYVPAGNREVPHIQEILETLTQQRALKAKATSRDTMHCTSHSNSQNQLQHYWGFFEGKKGLHLPPTPMTPSNFLSGSQAMDREPAGTHPNTAFPPH